MEERTFFGNKTDEELKVIYKNFCDEDYGYAGHETELGKVYSFYKKVGMKNIEEAIEHELLQEIAKRWNKM